MKEIIRVVAAVIYDHDIDSYYVGQRGINKKHPLKWEFIGGKIEKGEDLVVALKREFMEEVGIEVLPGKILEKSVFDYGREVGIIEVNFLECEKFTGDPIPDPEVYKTCSWVPRLELTSLDWVEADKDFANKLAYEQVPSFGSEQVLGSANRKI